MLFLHGFYSWMVVKALCSVLNFFYNLVVMNLKLTELLRVKFSFDPAGTANNAGAILVLGRDLVVVPKLIHPLPPAITSPETSPERHIEDTWMQVQSFDLLGSLHILVHNNVYDLRLILFLYFFRSLMLTDHLHQQEVVLQWLMIVDLLLGFRYHLPDRYSIHFHGLC